MPKESFDEELARLAQTYAVREQLAYMKAQEEVELVELSDLGLRDLKERGWTPPEFRIDGLHVKGNYTSITATYKCGKSTLMMNLVKSLLDGRPFVGQKVEPIEGNVGYWNLELQDALFMEWATNIDLQVDENRLRPLMLRGVPFPLWHPEFAKKVIEWGKRNEIQSLIIDPIADLLPGWPGSERGIENNNDLIRTVNKQLLEIKEASGIEDLFLVMHTGHNAKGGDDMHARGASTWGATPDHLWFMWAKKLIPTDQDPTRHFRADGRTGSFPTKLLAFDPRTGLYTPEDSLEAVQARGRAKAVVLGLISVGGTAGKAELRHATKGISNEAFPAAVEEAAKREYIVIDRSGKSHIHTLNKAHPEVQEMYLAQGEEL